VLCAQISSGVSEGGFWQSATERVVRDLLHAAALEGLGPRELNLWAGNVRAARAAVGLLHANSHAVPGWADDLDAVVSGDDRMRGSVWAMVSNVFAALGVPAIAEQFSPSSNDELHPEEFLRSNGTLFLLGTASGAVTTSRFIAALIEDVVTTARTDASSRPGARLDPPLSLILDEAANFPLPSLTGLMSEGGGTGISTTVVFQSLAQARSRWGRDQADAIWETATAKVILGGGASAQDLRDLAQLIGDRDVKEVSYSYESSGRSASRTESVRQRSIIDAAQLRSIPLGKGLMLLRTAPPIMLDLSPWTARKDAKQLQSDRGELEEQLRQAAHAANVRSL
jgi:type IV secretory pathway TraG/TraD family ATPase VirD4